MPRIFARVVLAVGCAAAWVTLAWAGPSSSVERLLPKTTKGVVLVTDVPQLVDRWEKTQLGQLMADPVMKPFSEDLRRQFEDRLSKVRERLGLKLDDLRGVFGGPLAAALIQPAKDRAALALLVDVTGHAPQAKALLEKVSANLVRQGAKRQGMTVQGKTVIVFDLPETEEYPAGKAAYFLSDNLLGVSDDLGVMEEILKRHLGQAASDGGSLADAPTFRAVMDRCQKSAGPSTPQIRWFIEPLGYVEALRTATPEEKRRAGTTVLDVVRNQGFDAVEGLGGFVDLGVEGFEAVHRTAIHAPPPYRKAPPPYQNKVSMNMFVLPNAQQFTPPPWVPNDAAACATIYWNVLEAFDNFGPLFDELVGGLDFLFEVDLAMRADLDAGTIPKALGKEFDKAELPLKVGASVLVEDPGKQWRVVSDDDAYVIKASAKDLKVYLANTGVWDDVLGFLKEEENGPQIDLRSEVMARLGQRVTVLTDYELPITPTSERLLVAIEARDEAALAAGIKKYFANDPTIKAHEFEGLLIWETIEDQRHEVPDAPVIDLPDFAPETKTMPRPGRRGAGGPQGQQNLLPHKAVAVAHGHLMIASHYDFLVKILDGAKKPDPLAESIDYRVVQTAMEQLGAGKNCFRSFSRTDEEYRPTYELIRAGKMPESETVFGRMLNAMFGPRKRGAIRQQKVDGQELPDYQVVRRYLGPAGLFGVSEPDGWFFVGFMLKK
ncbi:MAG: hypothetical protein JW809_16980 [Pirellulales bacterium]|nr:hypothetical protein [Pirellulales bacterium]